MKFAEIPVSPYTGASDVSVPIYTIQAKGMSIPIELSYHTGGIKLNEEAGLVGIGWALIADATISRTVHDKDDFLRVYNGPTSKGDLGDLQEANSPAAGFNVNKYLFCFACGYNVSFANGSNNDLINLFTTTTTSDSELDTYAYNIFGKSGKFFINAAGAVVMQKQENIRIQMIHIGGSRTFQVTDENGNQYYFGYIENYQPTTGDPQISSWHITKVTTQQKDVVNFTYTTATSHISITPDIAESYRLGCRVNGHTTSSFGTSSYDNVNLQQIDFTSGQVKFFYSGPNRHDLKNADKLDSIQVYSKTTAGLKYLKTNKLYYSYFDLTGMPPADSMEVKRLRLDSVKEITSGIVLPAYKFDYRPLVAAYPQKHGFAVDHWGYYNGKGNTTFIPSYGATINPAQNIGSPQGVTFIQYTGANREPDTAYSKTMALTKVTYPTGGYTTFDYDPNNYDYDGSIVGPVEYPQLVTVTIDTLIQIDTYGHHSGHIDFSKISNTIVPPASGLNATVKISYISKLNSGWPSSVRNTFGKLNYNLTGPTVNFTSDIGNTDLICSGLACSVPVTGNNITISQASATAYTWDAYVDSSIPDSVFSLIRLEVTFQGLKTVVQGNPTLTAGGLRVSAITDYSASGVVAKKRTWDYGYGSTHQRTYGRLMSFPVYAYGEFISGFEGVAGICQDLTLFSSSINSLTSVTSGNSVGYSQVAEYTIDPSNSSNNGKIVYTYFNSPDSTIFYNGLRPPGVMNMGNNLNGSLLTKTTYSNHGADIYWKVSETDNYYHTANRSAYYTLKYTDWHAIADNNVSCSTDPSHTIYTYLGYFYPYFKSERVLLDSTRNVVYDQNDTLKYLVSTTRNYYDDTLHYYPTRVRTIDSKGNKHVTKTTYPQDYVTTGGHTGNAILDSLILHNMVAETIEKHDSLYYPGGGTGYVTSATQSRYKQLTDSVMVHDKEYRLDITNPVTNFVPMSVSGNTYNQDSRYRQLISFDTYDATNNIAQYTLTNELPVSIIWDYKHVSPIAQVKNAALADAAYTSFEADGTGGWTIASSARDSTTAAITGIKSYNMSSGNITKTGLTSGTTYVVSYWTKNSSAYTITGTITGYPIKGATINGWTYYEHKVTGQTTITISGTGNIDELRLYPQNAQMTSYTYTPGVGVTTISDARGGINYYEYDNLQRLINIKDQNGNILKSYDYHYAFH